MSLPATFYKRFSFILPVFAIFIAAQSSRAQTVHILFDATKAEMAGNADWVIDADQTNLGVGSGGAYITSSGNQSNPQRIPTPAQSGITASTSETYWTGALSSWAVDCVNKGYVVETLPWNGQITYGNAANAQDLTNYQVYVIDEPNIVFSSSEKTALLQFVQNGGGLFVISDHNNSDRNGDGWDSPHIWNDFFTNNSVSVNPFGIAFDLADFSQTTTNISATATDSIIHGPMGNVAKAQWSGGTTMTLSPSINPSVKGVIFESGTTPGNVNAMVAYGRYGNGKFAAMGDSSPSDDGTGNPGCTLYNGYWSDASGNHRLLLMNMTIWLAEKNSTVVSNTGVSAVTGAAQSISIFPNPANGVAHLISSRDLTNVVIKIVDLEGNIVLQKELPSLSAGQQCSFTVNKGFYIVKTESDQVSQTCKFIAQ